MAYMAYPVTGMDVLGPPRQGQQAPTFGVQAPRRGDAGSRGPMYPQLPRNPYGGYNPPGTGFPTTPTGEPVPVEKARDVGRAINELQRVTGMDLLGSFKGSGSGSGAGGGGGEAPARIQMPDTSAARAAAFGRAKDLAGQQARTALTSLRESMGARGLLGSGLEAAGTGEIIGRTAQGLTDVGRDQAIQDVMAAQQLAQMGYQGDITQRGQDIQAQMAREQAARQNQQQSLQGLLSVLESVKTLY